MIYEVFCPSFYPPITPVCSCSLSNYLIFFSLSHDLSTIILIFFFYQFPSDIESNTSSCRKHRKYTFSQDLLIFGKNALICENQKITLLQFYHFFPQVHRSVLHLCLYDMTQIFLSSFAHYSWTLTTQSIFLNFSLPDNKFFTFANCTYQL